MAEFPAFPLWTDAYLGDTNHLTTIEHGAYLLLLITLWRSKTQELPDDDMLLARYTRTTSQQWARLRPILETFFEIKSGVWVQNRLSDEWVAVKQNSRRQSDKAKARWLKVKESPKPRQSRSDASLTLPISSNNTKVLLPFDEFWTGWKPFEMVKGSRQKALQLYEKALKEVDSETINRRSFEYIKSCHAGRIKTKHAETWLRGRCYLDEQEFTSPTIGNADSRLRDRVIRTAEKIENLANHEAF
jgi:uncharacterized protein YdaU (DUF1376 family)